MKYNSLRYKKRCMVNTDRRFDGEDRAVTLRDLKEAQGEFQHEMQRAALVPHDIAVRSCSRNSTPDTNFETASQQG
jgi:hypothetical protein